MSVSGRYLLVVAWLTGLVSDSSLLRHVVGVASTAPQPLTLQQKVAALEYQPSVQDGVLTAPNRAQGLRLRWAADGVEVDGFGSSGESGEAVAWADGVVAQQR